MQKFYSIHNPDSMYDITAIPDTLNIGDIPLGSELWAYIPQCLLPHLKFLPSQEYPHVSYVDLRPKIIDAQIFPDDNATHHGGWGTVLIGGLNMGGKEITTASAGTFYPSFFAIDITNPRNPQLLWEKTYPNLGFTTNIPCVLSVGSKWTGTEWINGQWYLAITSGPTDYTGGSDQAGRVFIVDLATGALLNTFVTTDANSYMNPPVSLDMGMNYNVDAIYTAANYLDGGVWKGRAYRIGIPQVGKTKYEPSFTDYNTNPAQWSMTKLFSSPQPLSAPFILSVDKKDNCWVYMGTGLYVEQADKTSTYQNYFFGIKDPFYNPDNNTTCYAKYPVVECELDMGDLFEADQFTGKIKAGGTIEGVSGITTYQKLLEEARKDTYRGWYRTLCPGSTDENGTCLGSGPSERALNKPAILGGILLVPTFSPNTDICGYGGTGRLFAVFYETGTAYKNRVVGEQSQDTILDVISLGEGLSSSFGVHVGKEEGGTLYGQLSTGEIAQIDITPAFNPKSAPVYWRELP
jgi:type IV pilus assembly protein PilY1